MTRDEQEREPVGLCDGCYGGPSDLSHDENCERQNAAQVSIWMENPEESIAVLKRCLNDQIRITDELIAQRDAAALEMKRACMAALCSHCASGSDAEIGFKGDHNYDPEFWHSAGLLSVRCRASAIRAMSLDRSSHLL